MARLGPQGAVSSDTVQTGMDSWNTALRMRFEALVFLEVVKIPDRPRNSAVWPIQNAEGGRWRVAQTPDGGPLRRRPVACVYLWRTPMAASPAPRLPDVSKLNIPERLLRHWDNPVPLRHSFRDG